MKYIIALLLLVTCAYSQKLRNIEDTSLEIYYPDDYEGNKDEIFIFAYTQPDIKIDVLRTLPTEGIVPIQKEVNLRKLKQTDSTYYILGKNSNHDKILLTGLLPKSYFELRSYRFMNGEYRTSMIYGTLTKATEPLESPEGIIFKNTDTDHLFITWKDAINSEGSLLLVSKDKPPIPPVDGELFHPSLKYGTSKAVNDGATYSLFSGRKDYSEFIKIDNLEYGTYYFQVYSYNGDKEYINYNINPGPGNPREVTMKLAAPEMDDFDYLEETIELEWTEVKGAEVYELQVALDPEFITLVENYELMDVGKTTKFEMYAENAERHYYVRVRARNGRNISQWSNIMEIED
ncbi:MAG: hypothetical protein CVV25_14635 [Ignavibacteriae bacterium HGW-Ignavibacteriae-4]|jgi:hypothetical protein|nr:MAG: hypothetical protein CVV25_14635 [Ignavibacteriae bacterium HGW-Ignavibacteriae-4]